MVRKSFGLLTLGAIGVALLWAAPRSTLLKETLHMYPVTGGSVESQSRLPRMIAEPPLCSLDDYVGTVHTAGTTEYDNQHNGTCGRMLDVNAGGMVSVTWTNILMGDFRCVYANLWNPLLGDFVYDSIGYRIDNSLRAGYICQTALSNGHFCFAFHQLTTTSEMHPVTAIPPVIVGPNYYFPDLEFIWPKINDDINGTLHMISTENPGEACIPLRMAYSRGTPIFDSEGFPTDIHWDSFGINDFELWDTVTVISPDVACSRRSLRCAVAFCHPMSDPFEDYTQIENEVYLRVSEDGGLNWGEFRNITQWTPMSGGIGDTLRAYVDVSVLLDEEDRIHLAFTTIRYVDEGPDSGLYGIASKIFHWSEETDFFSLVADGWYEGYEPGIWQRNVQRPSLAIDTLTGCLYCSYMQYDTTTCSENGYPMADAFVTVSTNGGCSWAAGTNVTNTTPDMNPVPTGASMHERDVTVAPLVTDGFLHMEYILDKDAGSMVHGEGMATFNPVIYQRIPVDQIAISPLLPEYPMHFDSTGFPHCESRVSAGQDHLPERFSLYQNYPNPFNPTTTLHFELRQAGKATLIVYNVLGQEVARLLSNEWLAAGVHQIRFDGSNLPSGIYIYSLLSDVRVASKKMVLMK